MNLTLFGVIALISLGSDVNAQFGAPGFANLFAPPAAASGWAIGQDASRNAVDFAVSNAISKVNVTELPVELQQELQTAIAQAELGLAACDELLTVWNVWRYKICKFSELSKLKLKIQEIKLLAQTYATSTTPVTFQSTAQSTVVAA